MPYMQSQGGVRLSSGLSHPPVTFQPQPNLGGLGIMGDQPAQGYYSPNMVGLGLCDRASPVALTLDATGHVRGVSGLESFRYVPPVQAHLSLARERPIDPCFPISRASPRRRQRQQNIAMCIL